MKLWHISQTENRGYDTFDSAVVAAETEEAARLTHPYGEKEWDSDNRYGVWCETPDAVTVRLIGEAAPAIEAGVICASLNAG